MNWSSHGAELSRIGGYMGPIGRYMGPSVSVNHGILCTLLDSCEFKVPSSYFSKKKKEKKEVTSS